MHIDIIRKPIYLLSISPTTKSLLLRRSLELCEESGSDTAASDHLCHMVDGSISVIYSIIGNNTSTADIEGLVSSQVTTTLQDIFAEPSPQPKSLGASLIMPITTTPPDYLISENIGRKIVSPTTVASFCAGLFATIAPIYLTRRKYHSRIESRNKRSEEGGDSTPRRSLRRIGILSPRGGQNYLDLDDNILPDSSGTAMASGFQANAFNFEPVLAATTSTESESVSLSAEPSTFASIQSPASSDSSCPFDDLPEDDSRSYGSVDLDCSVIGDGDGDLSTIYEEPTFSHSVSF